MLDDYVSHPTWERHCFGSVGGVVVCVVCVVYVIPCERDDVLNFTFKLEPSIDHMKVSDEFEN